MGTCTSPYVKRIANGNLPYDTGRSAWCCDNVGGGMGRFEREGTCAYLRLIHADAWQKPAQHCRAITLQLRIPFLKKREAG